MSGFVEGGGPWSVGVFVVAAAAVVVRLAAGLVPGVRAGRAPAGSRDDEDHALVRAAHLVVVLVLLWIAVDRLLPGASRVEAPRRQVVTTAGAAGSWIDSLRQQASSAKGAVVVHQGAGSGFATALAVAELAARSPDEVALVWTGPWDEQRSAFGSGPPTAGGAFRVGEPLGYEPERVRLRLAGRRPRVGRPTALDLLVVGREGFDGLPDDLELSVTLDGERSSWRPSDRLAGARGFSLPWTPARARVVAVEVELDAGAGRPRAVASGEIEVAPAAAEHAPVAVFGEGAEGLVAALQAQGVAARTFGDAEALGAALRDAPPGTRTVVALSEPDVSLQELLRERVGDGDGLLLAGTALPRAGQVLEEISPFGPLPEARSEDGVGGEDGQAAEGAPENAEQQPPPGGEPVGPPPPPDGPRPETGPDDGAALDGDTSAADTTDIEEAEVERRRVALVLVVDRSGSMSESTGRVAGPSKMALVKTSAFRIAQGLEPHDRLGVIAFHQRPSVVVDLGPIPAPEVLRARLEIIRADGLTKVGHALRAAEEMLGDTDLPVRHVVLLTDGEELDSTDVRVAQAAARRLARAGATVSVIHVATSRLSGEVAEIASFGGGKYLKTEDGQSIPRLMFAEVRRVLGAAGRRLGGEGDTASSGGAGAGDPGAVPEQPVDEAVEPAELPVDEPEPSSPPVGPEPDRPLPDPAAEDPDSTPAPPVPVFPVELSPLVEPWADEGFPPLRGGPPLGLRARRSAQVLLATGVGEPVFGIASRGLGRVAGFSVPVGGLECAAWVDDPRYPSWWATWIEAIRPAARSGEAESEGRELVGEFTLEEPAIRPAELERLAGLAGRPVLPVSMLGPGRERVVREAPRPAGADDARLGLLALLGLAVLERLMRGGTLRRSS